MKTLSDLFETFKEREDATAFVYRTGVRRFVFSYQELYDLSLKMACLLEKRGIEKGDRVLLWAPNSPWWGIAFWGIIARGGVVVPVDFMSGKERAAAISQLTESKLIIQSQYKLDKITAENSVLMEELEYLFEDMTPLPQIIKTSPSDTAEIIYTSGSTGDPKGVVLTHQNLLANLAQITKRIPFIKSEWKFLSLLPLSHTLEQMGSFLVPLSRGSAVVYMRTLKPSAIMEAFAQEDIYAAALVPRLLQALKNAIEKELADRHVDGVFMWLARHMSSLKKETRKHIFFSDTQKVRQAFLALCFGRRGARPGYLAILAGLGF